MENGQAIGEFGTFLESGNHTTEMTTKTFTVTARFKARKYITWINFLQDDMFFLLRPKILAIGVLCFGLLAYVKIRSWYKPSLTETVDVYYVKCLGQKLLAKLV